VLELKGKIESAGAARVVAAMDTDADLIEALVGLGYRRDEARSALGHVGKEARGAEARLKAALKVLAAGRKK
jgi:Holliday junction resolvasome RuvABC DNA-binding subunit